jgi:flagellar motor switch protein FliM
VSTETIDTTAADSQDIIDDLDLDSALESAADLGLDLEEVLNADPDAEPEDGVRAYDFNRPHSISRRFEQNLHNVAELFARSATVSLTSLLRSNVMAEFLGVSLKAFGEYRDNLPRPTCLAATTLRPLAGQNLMHLDLSLCFVILKKLMGGRPDSEERIRSFTEIERGIFGHFVGRLNELLKGACSKLVDIEPELVGLENNPDYVAAIPAGETVVCLRFRLRVEAVEGLVEMVLPLTGFSPVREVFDPEEHLEVRSGQEIQADRRQILDMIQATASELVVRLGELSMPLDRILGLQEGDLLQLSQAVDSPLTVLVEGREVFLAEAGRINQNRAVKLVRKLEKE